MISKLFKNIFKSNSEEKYCARKALENAFAASKESRTLGHPCPDYAYKRSLEKTAVTYAKLALQKQDIFKDDVREGLQFIVDAYRLQEEDKPVSHAFYQQKIEIALKAL